MGIEISFPRKSGSNEGRVNHRLRNNYHPLHFHQVHGENIKLSKDSRIAWRAEGFSKGIVFSDRPVLVNERVQVKFLEISSNWSGALRIGFTTNDPLSMKSKLPRYACPDLTSMNGNWAKAIAERLAKKNAVLSYFVNPAGEVHYAIDTEEYGVFFGGVNVTSKLWAVLDIYGNTTGVEFVDDSLSTQLSVEDVSNTAASSFDSYEIPFPMEQHNDFNNHFCFQEIHGKNVFLKKKGSIVSRKPGCNTFAYAFLSESLKVGQAKVIKVVETDNFFEGTLQYGVTSCNPASLNSSDLPECADDLVDRPEYWVVKEDKSAIGNGDCYVYHLSAKGELTVLKNGSKVLEVFYVDCSLVLWLFFNLSGKVSALTYAGSYLNTDNFSLDFEKMKIPHSDSSSSSREPSRECVICCEQAVNCVIYRCGHMCTCFECAQKMYKPSSSVQCPICREPIQDIIKIY